MKKILKNKLWIVLIISGFLVPIFFFQLHSRGSEK